MYLISERNEEKRECEDHVNLRESERKTDMSSITLSCK
jgi:hypothetical protein